jgi:hypothetical protein
VVSGSGDVGGGFVVSGSGGGGLSGRKRSECDCRHGLGAFAMVWCGGIEEARKLLVSGQRIFLLFHESIQRKAVVCVILHV